MQTTTQQTPAQTVMTVTQAADYLGLAVSTLNKWRCHGGGPIYIKLGRAVRYRTQDLDEFINLQMRENTFQGTRLLSKRGL